MLLKFFIMVNMLAKTEKMEIKPIGRLQPLFEYVVKPASESEPYGGFIIQRARIGFKGKFGKKIRFLVRYNVDLLIDGKGGTSFYAKPKMIWAQYKFYDWLKIRIGQDLQPSSRANLTSSKAFLYAHPPGYVSKLGEKNKIDLAKSLTGGLPYDVGTMIWGFKSLSKKLHTKYYIAFANGGTEKGIIEKRENRGKLITRLEIQLFNPHKKTSHVNTLFGKKSVMFGFSYNNDFKYYDSDGDTIADKPLEILNADIFTEFPINKKFVINNQFVYSIKGIKEEIEKGKGFYFSTAVLYKPLKLQIYVIFENYKEENSETQTVWKFGLNYYINKFNTVFKLYGGKYEKETIAGTGLFINF